MLSYLNYSSFKIKEPRDFIKASALILPGVGSFDYAISSIEAMGIKESLNNYVTKNNVPVLGICLGAQIMTKRSDEGNKPGFGWIDAETIKFKSETHKTPHMGWNTLKIVNTSSILQSKYSNQKFYFIHSYHFKFFDSRQITAYTNYDYQFPVSFQLKNIFGVQFHPEKSHVFGMEVMQSFCSLSNA
jgi:glutamine amidotransferase